MFKFHKQRLSVLLFIACLLYSITYISYASTQLSYVVDFALINISSSLLNFSFIFDKVSLSFSALVTFISGCVFLFARAYMSSDPFYYRFMWVLLSFVLSMNMLILSGSYLTLLVGWDGLGVSSFALIIYYQNKESLVSGFLTLLINRLGDVVIMSLIFYMCLSGFSLLINYQSSYQYPMLFLLAVGALTKSAQYPFSVWLPAAMAAPTPVSALVHSSTLVTAGVYIIIRAMTSMSLPLEVMSLLLFCGSLTSLLGGACAVVENDLKKIIALSTLSQLGIMMFSLGLGSQDLSLLHLYAHAMFKALLFLVAGVILMVSFGVQDIRLLGSVTLTAPLLLVFMNISTFCLMGLPFLSAFYSKHMILNLMWSSGINMLSILMMLLSTGLTGLYMFRLLKAMNWGTRSQVTIMPMLYWGFYSPMYLLFMGSMMLGFMFSYLDANLPMNFYTPGINDIIVNFSVGMGVLIGILMNNRKSVSSLTNMLYLVPLWYKSPSLYNIFSTQMKLLDKGWLEPYYFTNMTYISANKVMDLSSWPMLSFNTLPYMSLLGGLVSFMWFSLKC